MKKNINIWLLLTALVYLMLGCANYTETVSKDRVVVSSLYKHSATVINVPYVQALANFKKGISLCANSHKSPNVTTSTGSTRFVGIKVANDLMETSATLAEFESRVDGYIQVYATLEKASTKTTKLTYHSPWKTESLIKWAKGDNTACHGFPKK